MRCYCEEAACGSALGKIGLGGKSRRLGGRVASQTGWSGRPGDLVRPQEVAGWEPGRGLPGLWFYTSSLPPFHRQQ